jgi:hypothetical protein
LVQLKTVTQPPIEVGGTRVTPESQVLEVRLPFGGLCFIWHRPTAVTVEHAGRAIQRLPIVDLTRLAQASALVLAILCLIASSQYRES